MTKSSHWLGAIALACFATLSACGTKGGGGSGIHGSGSPVPTACLGQAFSSACDSCIQSSCEAALGAFGSDCSDYIDCYCPNGAYNASAQTSQTCVSRATSNPSCLSSAQGINSCLTQTCATACQSTGGASGSSSGGSGGGASGSSGSGGGATAACGVAFSSASCATCVNSNCCSATQSCGKDQGCLDMITCIHGCNGNSSCQQNCITNASSSAQSELSAAVNCWISSCGKSGC